LTNKNLECLKDSLRKDFTDQFANIKSFSAEDFKAKTAVMLDQFRNIMKRTLLVRVNIITMNQSSALEKS
jgi:hypothetical protein